jgi:hypothetical protein
LFDTLINYLVWLFWIIIHSVGIWQSSWSGGWLQAIFMIKSKLSFFGDGEIICENPFWLGKACRTKVGLQAGRCL